MSFTPEQVTAGQAVYNRRTLKVYDLVVLGISNRFIWKCPTRQLEAHYNRFLSGNHLDVGVGSGYFLAQCRFPVEKPRLALMDLNSDSLAFAAQRVKGFSPETYQRNVLEAIPFSAARFDSVGINYLLHCLPGRISAKASLFDHLQPLMNPGASVFGATLLQEGVERGLAARSLMAIYNRKGIFSNREDSLPELQRALAQRFNNVQIDVVGCAAIFSATA